MNSRKLLRSLFESHSIVAGLDEAGRGPLAGPVFAAAVAIEAKDIPFLFSLKLKDSKVLSAKKRDELYGIITQSFAWSIGICTATTIDRLNILQATLLAMKKSLDGLAKKPGAALIDGNWAIPGAKCIQQTIIDGDALVPLISAASIIAKVSRDRLLKKLAKKYPQYGFEKNKGYGTKFHLECLKKNGPCPIHRRSFGPVRNFNR